MTYLTHVDLNTSYITADTEMPQIDSQEGLKEKVDVIAEKAFPEIKGVDQWLTDQARADYAKAYLDKEKFETTIREPARRFDYISIEIVKDILNDVILDTPELVAAHKFWTSSPISQREEIQVLMNYQKEVETLCNYIKKEFNKIRLENLNGTLEKEGSLKKFKAVGISLMVAAVALATFAHYIGSKTFLFVLSPIMILGGLIMTCLSCNKKPGEI